MNPKAFPLFIWQTLTIVFNFSSFTFVLRCKLQWFSVVEWSLHSWSTLVIITRNIRYQVDLCVFSGIYQLHYISSFRHSVLGFVSKLIQSSKLYNKYPIQYFLRQRLSVAHEYGIFCVFTQSTGGYKNWDSLITYKQ